MAALKERYARALLDLSVEQGTLDVHMKQAAFLLDALKEQSGAEYLRHPHLSYTAKKELMQSLFKERVSEDLMEFLYLALAKKQEDVIVPALSAFLELGNRYLGKTGATVVSALPLTDEQIARLRALLKKKLGQDVELTLQVEPSIIGGFYIHVEDRLIDRSLRTQLKNLRESMERGGVH